MVILTVPTTPFAGQQPGTSGLRKKVTEFQKPNYLENFVQAVFESVGDIAGQTLVVGGDGRYHNKTAIQTIIRQAAANGLGKLIIGQNGIFSTPALSNVVRRRGAFGGIILSASHNPGGPTGDFGIKFNCSNGGPAPEKVTEAIYARTKTLSEYKITDSPDVDLSTLHTETVEGLVIEVIDAVDDYLDMVKGLFDFAAIKALFASGFTAQVDALSAVAGPYALRILEGEIGAPAGTVTNAVPLEDFGGHHPDPNPANAAHLVTLVNSAQSPDFAAALDGDADRNMILGRGIVLSPSDSLAILTANAALIPSIPGGVVGVARSMPTSAAVDRVAAALGVKSYETPTGWKFFGNLLDSGLITICGEESYGTGSGHIREKDGLWAILFWLNLLAVTKKTVAEIVADHFAKYGRNYYSRHDYEAVESEKANALVGRLRAEVAGLKGQVFQGLEVEDADDFKYVDPVDNSVSERQGIRILFKGGARLILRLSGTGTVGATLRVYFDALETDPAKFNIEPQVQLAPLIAAAEEIAKIREFTGRTAPTVIT
jgi:phosphoglucomutase